MFANHQPHLSRLGRASPDGFARIATFALCTIRQPLRLACADYKVVRQGDTTSLFGAKRAGLACINAHAEDLWRGCEYAYETGDDETAECAMLHTIMAIPGIGPAKAGFIAQMIYGLSGCIDTHNLTRFGVTERAFRGREAGYSAKRLGSVVRDYNAFCRRVGGTAALWDGWCTYLAERDPINYASAHRVSELHLAPLEV